MSFDFSEYDQLSFDHPAEGVLRITLNRPERLNALDSEGHRQLTEIWRAVDKDQSISAVIIRGAGRGFSAGGDFEMIEELIEDFDARARLWRETRDLVYNIINCGKPIVSAIHGPAVGAGLVAALLADISIATPNAKIVDGHTRLGVAAGDHAAIIWPLLCGMARAKYHLLLCEPMTGERAAEVGLVSLCVDEADLEAKSIEIASRLAGGAPNAIRWTKYAMNNWLRMAGPSFDVSTALEMLGFTGPEVVEGLASHREKRAPVFSPNSPL
ncbi:enoyl-CoA hydratase/isomerase family protein [Nitratireductor sp. XY-223]|uniref:enoyl-CoA hydratase/isomerase family protein n=1 Tax=Nitratireductor sp. XY-223 TaxID=2561926 RepID=UPI0010AA50DD|nr:enoyl-CoA hydratase/isomerase family protein [Nitratireductor sp. XY-223]